VSIEVFRVTRENKHEPKDTWWWNDDVQKAINEKKKCYKHLAKTRGVMKTYISTKKLEET
jgi:transcriptional regulator with AAA-type ATPase domain